MESIANEGDCEGELLKADGRKLLFEMCVMQEDKVVEEGLHRKTIIQGAG
jgi:predicted thioesterase